MFPIRPDVFYPVLMAMLAIASVGTVMSLTEPRSLWGIASDISLLIGYVWVAIFSRHVPWPRDPSSSRDDT